MSGRSFTAGAAALLGVAVVACGSSNSSGPFASPSSSTTTTAASIDSPLKGLLLLPAQVLQSDPMSQAAPAMVPSEASTALQGPAGVTLTACGGSFPSEAQRTQRVQVDYVDNSQHRIGATNEVVRYSSAAIATQAFQELKAAVANCAHPWTLSDMRQEPAGTSLAAQQVILSGQMPAQTGNAGPVFGCFVYQFRGDLLSGVYVYRGSRDAAVSAAGVLGKASAALLNAQP
jgi:hypothetical protein